MQAKTEATAKEYRAIQNELNQYKYASSLAQWDMNTGAPKKGFAALGEMLSYFTEKAFALSYSERMGELLYGLLEQKEELTPALQRELSLVEEDYRLNRAVPSALMARYASLVPKSDATWKEAKEKNDFSLFAPVLEELRSLQFEIFSHQGYKKDQFYNAMLHQFEPKLTAETFSSLADILVKELPPLIQAIGNKGASYRDQRFYAPINPAKQREISLGIITRMGYDLAAGRVDETVHPFCIPIRPGDVRVTTHTYEKDILNGLYSCMHEAGHALYMQGCDPAYASTPLNDGASYGMHESQSRFWEMMVGTSRPFAAFLQKELSQLPEFAGLGAEALYRHQNAVVPGTIRLQSDELCYNLHIVLRFYMEQQIVTNELPIKDIPEAWNDYSQKLLGRRPETDAAGCLQDSHWSSGLFGYFPSYTIGNLAAAQILVTLRKAMPDLDSLIEKGEFAPLRAWLLENIHRHGRLYTADELLRRITGEPLNSSYFTAYAKQKFGELYNL